MPANDPVEIVDENDVFTGKVVTKRFAHDNKLPHRCAAVFVFNADGRLYVQPHVKSNYMLDHSVGGHVDVGETYLDAAKREMKEEIGIYNVELEEVATSYYSFERRYIHLFGIFECIAPKNWSFHQTEEVESLQLMTIEEIVDLMSSNPEKFTGGFINTMKKYIEVKELPFKVEG